MNLFTWLFGAAAATSIATSPLPNSYGMAPARQPATSFGELEQTAVLGDETAMADSPVLTITPTPSPSPKPNMRISRKSAYTIALLGDSMIDTLGPDAPHLKKTLSTLYPGRSFTIYNYGVGGTNIDYGITRITNSYSYLGNSIPALVSRHPDIVVVESFGYNPYTFDAGALEKHWLALATIVDMLKQQIPGVKIIIAATIAPNSKFFGDGAPGISFSAVDKQQRTAIIKSYLDSTVKFAKSQHLPLADLYHPSLDGSGDGKLIFINGGDHIHYSDSGRILFAKTVSDAIVANKLLE